MQRRTFWTAATATILALPLGTSVLAAQSVPLHSEDMPLAKDLGIPNGQDVTPAWEGWYPNPDGTSTIYFGYYNRNSEEVMHIPVGPDNQVTVGGEVVDDVGQPTDFQPGREWGVFGVVVPGDFTDEVVWTLRSVGRTYSIPGSLNPVWMTDVIAGDADGNFPPKLRFSENGVEGEGPLGLKGPTMQATVGVPLDVTVWGSHEGPEESGPAAAAGSAGFGGRAGGRGGGPPRFQIRWYKHSGPGNVTFSEPSGNIPGDGGMATTQVTFDAPGTYVIRVTAAQGGMVGQGHGQCCWTNGFVEVMVTAG